MIHSRNLEDENSRNSVDWQYDLEWMKRYYKGFTWQDWVVKWKQFDCMKLEFGIKSLKCLEPLFLKGGSRIGCSVTSPGLAIQRHWGRFWQKNSDGISMKYESSSLGKLVLNWVKLKILCWDAAKEVEVENGLLAASVNTTNENNLNHLMIYTREFVFRIATRNQTIVNGHIVWTSQVTLSSITKHDKLATCVCLRI